MRLSKGALIASAVAAMVMAVGCAEEEDEKSPEQNNQTSQSVKCQGINECAGKGECAGTNPDGTTHDCQGKGSCKGQSWITVPSAKECTDKGGTVITG